jgi:hypothetical protein
MATPGDRRRGEFPWPGGSPEDPGGRDRGDGVDQDSVGLAVASQCVHQAKLSGLADGVRRNVGTRDDLQPIPRCGEHDASVPAAEHGRPDGLA